ncbi:LysE family translocator [Anoxybacteroides tepidamans]|uniref:LysE family translocator n=1 Tax=Anoxybacteroides tepidamans TaxID=265948 RepID=UPI0004829860|nr:LysE family transporter [Anoxybacillus tepidamans]
MPLFSFLLYVIVSSFTPGPNNLMAMLFANKYGLKNTIRFCLGVGAGFFIVILLSSYFNLWLKNLIPKVQGVMTVLGVIYMVYLAVKIMMSKNHDADDENGRHNRFLMGMLLQFINPKGILYSISVASTFIIPYHTSNVSLILYSLFLAAVGFMSTFCWSAFGSIFQTFIAKYRSPFNFVMGLLLIYSAVSILVE